MPTSTSIFARFLIALSERRLQILIFLGFFGFFLIGRSYQVSDSLFSVLTGHALIHDQSINLKPYLNFPEFLSKGLPVVDNVQLGRQNLGQANERWVMLYPHMGAVLAIPLILMTDVIHPVTEGGFFNLDNEIRQQLLIAAFLCALYALVLYRLARLWLERLPALLALVVLVIGSSVTSILSRAIWSDTWGCLLTLIALYHLSQVHWKKSPLRPIMLAVLMSLMFYSKPIYALNILALLAWSVFIDRRALYKMVIVGAIFFALYLMWSLALFDKPVMKYDSFIGFQMPTAKAFWGVLISPSRGIFIFWSWLIVILCLARKALPYINTNERRFILISILLSATMVGLLSCYFFWFGGVGYGPRLQVPLLPFLSVVAIMVFQGYLRHRAQSAPSATKILPTLASLLIIISFFINIYGMAQPRSFYQWYHLPRTISSEDLMWDWSDPVFLAGMVGRERYTSKNPY